MQVSARVIMQTWIIAHQHRSGLGMKCLGPGCWGFLGAERCSQSERLENVFSPTPGPPSSGTLLNIVDLPQVAQRGFKFSYLKPGASPSCGFSQHGGGTQSLLGRRTEAEILSSPPPPPRLRPNRGWGAGVLSPTVGSVRAFPLPSRSPAACQRTYRRLCLHPDVPRRPRRPKRRHPERCKLSSFPLMGLLTRRGN